MASPEAIQPTFDERRQLRRASDALAPLIDDAGADPRSVFSTMAAACLPSVCDSVIVDFDIDGKRQRLSRPRSFEATPPGNRHVLRASFGIERTAHGADGEQVVGVAEFVWDQRVPSGTEERLATALLDLAVRTICWRRSEQRAQAAEAKAANLQRGMHTSRLIGNAVGILMSLHKLTDAQAFELLARASQRLNLKVRDVAVEVVETGWLDPQLQAVSHRARSGFDASST